MTERGILFSAPMVRALLAGRKSVTRRIIKPQPVEPAARPLRHAAKHPGSYFDAYCSEKKTPKNPRGMSNEWCWWTADDRPDPLTTIRCPYGAPGQILWCRETWQAWRRTSYEYDEHEALTREARSGARWAEWIEQNGKPDAIEYRATSKSLGPWTPAIHMPRWASRLTLEIVSVRVERLHAITEEDARAEGIDTLDGELDDAAICRAAKVLGCCIEDRRASYGALWAEINGEASLIANPMCWAISFKRIEAP